MYVRPDFFIAEIDGQWQAILNDYYLPRVSISDYYLRLQRSADDETKNYLRDKMQQARWVLSGLDRRHGTLQRCADALLDAQRDFFTGQTPQLRPMTLFSLAETMFHPSGMGIDLPEGILYAGDNLPPAVKQDRPGAGGTLIQRNNIRLHKKPPYGICQWTVLS